MAAVLRGDSCPRGTRYLRDGCLSSVMARAPRSIDPEGVYHVICRGNNKARIFHRSEDYEKYLSILQGAKRSYGFLLYHYVLMPNHVHLLLKPTTHAFSACMHQVQMKFAKDYCQTHHFVGHVWQGRFKSLLIENDAYVMACGNYIEMNPVRAGLVDLPDKWQWSSYRWYAFGEANELIDADPLFKVFEAQDRVRDHQLVYRQTISKTRAE